MRTVASACLLVLLAFTASLCQTCPSDKAAEAGVSAFSAFHAVVAPAWHQAYPAKDYDALMKAAPEFEKAFVPVAKLEAKMNNPSRKAAFLLNREDMAKYLKEYVAAAKTGDTNLVYELLPKLHEAFERTSAACIPTAYPEVEGVAITTKLILEKHLPADNAEGIAGSTETLVTRIGGLDEKSIPESLQDKKAELLKEFATWKELAAQMMQCSRNKDMTTYRRLATELGEKVSRFTTTYL
jgi:hypothetical protein